MQLFRVRLMLGALSVFAAMVAMTSASCDRAPVAQSAPAGGPTSRGVRVFKAPDPTRLKFAVVTNNVSDFWKITAAGASKYAKEGNVRIDMKMPQTGKVEEQNAILEALVREGYNGIAVSAVAPDEQVGTINNAARVTNVICFDSDSPKSDRLFYMGTDNFEAGKVLGQQIVRLLPRGGKMAVFVGNLSANNAIRRLKGIEDAVRGHDIDIVSKKEDDSDLAKARSNAEEVIRTYPDLNLLCGLWSYNGPAIAAAIEGSGKKGKLLAAVFDEEQGTIDAIKGGVIECTVVQKPFQFGYLSGRWLHELAINGDAVAIPEERNIDTGVRVIDARSVGAFEKELNDMKAE